MRQECCNQCVVEIGGDSRTYKQKNQLEDFGDNRSIKLQRVKIQQCQRKYKGEMFTVRLQKEVKRSE